MNIKVIGLGGIGNCLVPLLARFLNFHNPQAVLTFIDGDRFEKGNSSRQFFPRLGNKAEVTAEWLSEMFPEMLFRAEARHAGLDNLSRLVYNGDIVFLCVDNHDSRKLVSDHGENLSDVAIFSGGNEFTDGNVQIFIRREGKNVTLPLANEKYHPEIHRPRDKHPLAAACMQMTPRVPQLVFANNMAAAIMLNAFYAHLQGAVMPDDIYFDLLIGSCRPVTRSK
jgi:molybdopterin/thiamine biosynthesis adenylyltransferase